MHHAGSIGSLDDIGFSPMAQQLSHQGSGLSVFSNDIALLDVEGAGRSSEVSNRAHPMSLGVWGRGLEVRRQQCWVGSLLPCMLLSCSLCDGYCRTHFLELGQDIPSRYAALAGNLHTIITTVYIIISTIIITVIINFFIIIIFHHHHY